MSSGIRIPVLYELVHGVVGSPKGFMSHKGLCLFIQAGWLQTLAANH